LTAAIWMQWNRMRGCHRFARCLVRAQPRTSLPSPFRPSTCYKLCKRWGGESASCDTPALPAASRLRSQTSWNVGQVCSTCTGLLSTHAVTKSFQFWGSRGESVVAPHGASGRGTGLLDDGSWGRGRTCHPVGAQSAAAMNAVTRRGKGLRAPTCTSCLL